MTYTPLPQRPNLEWLRKRAKARLRGLRAAEPETRLHDAQHAVAREHGFADWRALKDHVDRVNREGRFRPDGVPAHLPTPDLIDSWPDFTPAAPLRVIVSGCLLGLPVGVDGSSYGCHPHITDLAALPNVSAVSFCPEAFAFGVPRATPDIIGGDGYDVLDGRARVMTPDGEDWTAGMLAAAHEMLRRCRAHGAHLAVLMDISAACGSQVIYRGIRSVDQAHQIGQGVCAALLVRNGVPVVSQRDYRTLRRIFRRLDPACSAADEVLDHHEIDWYRQFFAG